MTADNKQYDSLYRVQYFPSGNNITWEFITTIRAPGSNRYLIFHTRDLCLFGQIVLHQDHVSLWNLHKVSSCFKNSSASAVAMSPSSMKVETRASLTSVGILLEFLTRSSQNWIHREFDKLLWSIQYITGTQHIIILLQEITWVHTQHSQLFKACHWINLYDVQLHNPFTPKSDQFEISPCNLTRNINSTQWYCGPDLSTNTFTPKLKKYILPSEQAMKSQVLHTMWCNISGEAAGEIWKWSLLGVKGLKWWGSPSWKAPCPSVGQQIPNESSVLS